MTKIDQKYPFYSISAEEGLAKLMSKTELILYAISSTVLRTAEIFNT